MIWFYLDKQNPLPPNYSGAVMRSYEEIVSIMNTCIKSKVQFAVDFSYSLTDDKTGYDVAQYVVENKLPLCGFKVHGDNMNECSVIENLLVNYKYQKIE